MSKIRSAAVIGLIVASAVALSACGNTIRGVGKDTANAVHATKHAAHDVERAAN